MLLIITYYVYLKLKIPNLSLLTWERRGNAEFTVLHFLRSLRLI